MPKLRVIEGKSDPEELAFTQTVKIGRTEENDLIVFDETASRQHARIEPRDDQFILLDLGAANQTYVNGHPVADHRLHNGDEITIGATRLRFIAGRDTATVLRDDAIEVESSIPTDDFDPTSGADSDRLLSRLQLIYRANTALAEEIEVDRLLARVLAELAPALPLDRAAIVPCGDRAAPGAYWQRDPRTDSAFEISSTLLERVQQNSEGILVRSMLDEETLQQSESIATSRTRSAAIVPLIAKGENLGALYADAQVDHAFSRDDLELLMGLAAPIALAIRNAELYQQSRREAQRLRGEIRDRYRLVGESPQIRELLEMTERAAGSEATVVLLGETGTGKELVARALHEQSTRARGPFVAVNCAAIPDSLVESELFGHVRGAFTGANRDARGQFRAAAGGTIFLDEVGELPLEMQAKLLRVLEEREVRAVGAERPIPVDIRVVAATNRDLQQAVAVGTFRSDLYFRLSVLKLTLPPLREREGDVRVLAEWFLSQRLAGSTSPARHLSPAALDRLERYRWPGNVRELRNVIERASVLANGETIEPRDLPADVAGATERADVPPVAISLKEAERRAILLAIEATGGKKGEMVKRLGISWPTLNKKIREHGIEI